MVSFGTLLVEFIDHQIIVKKQKDGQEVLIIPLKKSDLEELLADVEQQ
jgi:hypothetical protein